jgi:hypothetical protein
MKLLNTLLIFSAALFFFAIFAPAGHMPSDTKYSLATAQAILKGHLNIQPSSQLTYCSQGKNGFYYSKYGIGYALMFVPSAVITHSLFKYTPMTEEQIHQILSSLTNTILAPICILLFISIMRKGGFSFGIILVSSLLIALCSPLLPYSKINHSELPTALLLLLFTQVWYDCKYLTNKNGLITGVISSLLILLKIGNIISAMVISACCIFHMFRRQSTKTAAILSIAMPALTFVSLVMMNINRYGTWINFGYGREQEAFTTPLFTGLYLLISSPSKSMFIFAPLLTVSFAGIVNAFSSAKRFHLPILILFLSNLLFYSCWHDWHGGWSWGPRLIIPVVILMHMYIPYFFTMVSSVKSQFYRNVIRSAFSLLIITGCVINLLGSLVWYQQIYFFHKDYTSIPVSHPVIAYKLFKHKLENYSEKYTCSEFNRNCDHPPYATVWNSISHDDVIDFGSFETYQGFSTFWGLLRARSGSDLYLIFPILFLLIALFLTIIYLILNRCTLNGLMKQTILYRIIRS